MSPPSVCPVCGVWSKGGALPSDSLCQGHYVQWCMSPECNAYHANLDGREQAWNAWLARMLPAPAAPREEGVRGIHPPEGPCTRCGGSKRDPEHEGTCGACTGDTQADGRCPDTYRVYRCSLPAGHSGFHRDDKHNVWT